MNKFFLVCPIGLENSLKSELTAKFQIYFPSEAFTIVDTTHGGIEIKCSAHIGFALNHVLKTPSKILLRIKEQKCRDLPKFFNIIKKIPWKNYLNQEHVEVSITAKKSRIIHTGKLEVSFHKALSEYFSANKIKGAVLKKHKEDKAQNIFIRLFEDNLTISFDTSGELLHIRGDRSFRGLASIRENIASLLLIELTSNLRNQQYNLIDPMCGTGTFLFEWRKRFDLQSREFLYMGLKESLLANKVALVKTDIHDNFKYYGFDINNEIISKNNNTLGITFKQSDIFEAKEIKGNNIVIVNPPFGKRVKISGDKVIFFKKLVEQIERVYKPERLGILIPRDFVGKLKGEKRFFKLNGIDICFLIRTPETSNSLQTR